jgi:hypothetical protein
MLSEPVDEPRDGSRIVVSAQEAETLYTEGLALGVQNESDLQWLSALAQNNVSPLPDLDATCCVVYHRVSSAEQERASVPMADRPALTRAVAACLELGPGVLLVEERTRLARDEYAQ